MGTKEKEQARGLITSLYEENYRTMMSMIAKDLVCNPIAEDIVQDTFCEAMRNWEKLLVHENPGGWLMDTAKYKMLSVKKRINSRSLRETMEMEEEWEYLENEYGLVEVNLLFDSSLTLREKTLFHMFYLEGYSMREIAQAEGISEGNCRVKMHRIRDKLRKYLEAESPQFRKRR